MSGFEYQKVTNEIKKDISAIQLLADDDCKDALKKCGSVYKSKVASYSAGTERFKGIGTGARVSVKKSKQGAGYFLVVKGSKKHAKLWHLANNGFIHVGNVKVEGNHFVDKAEKASESDVDKIINDALEKMARGK